jgi:hypothetical protein
VTRSSSAGTAAEGDSTSSGSSKGSLANATMTIGSSGPALQIVNGGVRLPDNIVNVNE